MTALAGLVPCADTGIRQMFLPHHTNTRRKFTHFITANLCLSLPLLSSLLGFSLTLRLPENGVVPVGVAPGLVVGADAEQAGVLALSPRVGLCRHGREARNLRQVPAKNRATERAGVSDDNR